MRKSQWFKICSITALESSSVFDPRLKFIYQIQIDHTSHLELGCVKFRKYDIAPALKVRYILKMSRPPKTNKTQLKQKATSRKTESKSAVSDSSQKIFTARSQLSFKDLAPVGSKERAQLSATLAPKPAHGGEQGIGRRKTSRPFYPKTSMHIVLKSKKARGEWSLLHRKHKSQITSMIYVYAKRFKVRVFNATNMGNHLHLLVKAEDRKNLADFLRVLAGRIAVTVTGARKHVKRIGKFWSNLCWSRLVNWGIDFNRTRAYIVNNLSNSITKNAKEYEAIFKEAVQQLHPDGPPIGLDELQNHLKW